MNKHIAEIYLNESNKFDWSNYANWKFKLQTLLEGFSAWTIANRDEAKMIAARDATITLVQDWGKNKIRQRCC